MDKKSVSFITPVQYFYMTEEQINKRLNYLKNSSNSMIVCQRTEKYPIKYEDGGYNKIECNSFDNINMLENYRAV
jgi:hypothetical protein